MFVCLFVYIKIGVFVGHFPSTVSECCLSRILDFTECRVIERIYLYVPQHLLCSFGSDTHDDIKAQFLC
jgi:hypothetical protein